MSCCCVKTLNLCNVPVCGTLEIKQAAGASESGITNQYTLVLDYLESAITLIQEQIEGENIKFNVGNLNESFQYTGQLFDSAGDPITVDFRGDTYDCIKFRTLMNINGEVAPPVLNLPGTVVIEAVVGESLVVTGTTAVVTGIAPDGITITCEAFTNVRVIVIRGNIPIPGIDPLDGSSFFTKLLANNYITLNFPLAEGEFIRIQTIPQ